MRHTSNTEGRNKTENHEGATAYVLPDKPKLVNLVSTSLFNEPKFYGETGDTEKEIEALCRSIAKKDPEFILKLASYARNELYLRSTPIFLLALASNIVECKPHVAYYCERIIKRADELNEVMAAYLSHWGKPIPNGLKKGVAYTMRNFDEYQFAKYNRKTDVTFKDVIMLTHPREPAKIIKAILDDKLEIPYTWETEISSKGNKPEVWAELIRSKKLGYMATLRNLRNILTSTSDKLPGIPDDVLDLVIAYISNEKAVRNSKQFPFRFFSAYRELADSVSHSRISDVLDAIEDAALIAYENIPRMKGTTVLACDVSCSMQDSVSRNSKIEQFDIGLLMGAACHKYCDKSYLGIFGDSWKTLQFSKHHMGPIQKTMSMRDREGEVGYSTNGYKVLEWINDENIPVDRILMFTDEEMWDSYGCDVDLFQRQWSILKKNNPNARMYLFNLNGYGTSAISPTDDQVVQINGWSDKILKFIETDEIGPNAQIKYIESNF